MLSLFPQNLMKNKVLFNFNRSIDQEEEILDYDVEVSFAIEE